MKTQLSFLSLFFFLQISLSAQEPLVAISDQMNVIYMGIDNPVTVAVENHPAENILITSEDVEIISLGKGKYNFIPKTAGKVILKVQPKGMAVQEIEYRVKRIPDPIARLGFKSGGEISLSNFIYYNEINAYLEGFDLGKCTISSFEMTLQRKAKGADPVSIKNYGQEFSTEMISLIKSVNSGDTVYFDNIGCQCPGDYASRKINSMIFKIK